MIDALEGFGDNIGAFACHGHVTKADYETVLIPAIEERLSRHDKVRIYYEIAPDFAGIDPGAVWEDTKVGFSHFLRWERFAVVTDVEWITHAVKLFGFLMPGEFRAFPTAQATQAREWIAQTQH
ncbi:STAS/SEC14 domain-containing protein [Mycobacterium sp.]|uniref:STAS/SEC14 domain-containing protein n=1 Tax=Mycobacterium sp. TaxID=1785 RepID=UPI002BE487DB|nr:STAS/SEC14 domain-containing protein [Mycobacterium sp.]HTQ22761.1 STAS/SEC14 domain-containing protein [Mycobacterium sp.]